MKRIRIPIWNWVILTVFTGLISPSAAQKLQSSNLPIIVVDTQGREIVNEPKISAKMGVIDNGPDIRNSVDDPYNGYDGFIGIEYRGSSSQFLFPKKSFAVETRDITGGNLNTELLGLPEENDWLLHGPYSDKSLIRNLLAYKLGRDQGRYATRTVPFELVLNNDYHGLYVLMEKIKKDSNRVDIATLNPDENSGDDLTGGYIVKIDKFDGENSGFGWSSPYAPPGRSANQEIFFQFHYPKIDEISPQQGQYIQNYITEFENVLAGENFLHPTEGYKKYIDLDSFIDYLIMMEVTRNVDGYRLSTFLYKDKDSKNGKLTLGPIWDFNLAFGNADYCQGWDYEGWAYDFNTICRDDYWLIPFWWKRFIQDPEFRIKLKTRWTELRNNKFSTINILLFIDDQAQLLEEAQQRNFQRWPVLDSYVWPNAFVGGNYPTEIQYLKEWVNMRLQWLDTNIGFVVTGINEITSTQTLNPYPNPFTENTTFSIPSNGKLSIFNYLGEIIYESRVNPGLFIWEGVSTGGYSVGPGTYIFNYESLNGTRSQGRILKF